MEAGARGFDQTQKRPHFIQSRRDLTVPRQTLRTPPNRSDFHTYEWAEGPCATQKISGDGVCEIHRRSKIWVHLRGR